MDPLKTKRCSCCYADVLLFLYHRCTSARDGRQNYCIECKAKYNGRTSEPAQGPGSVSGQRDTVTYSLPSRDLAWGFMRACDEGGIMAGYPALVAHDVRTPAAHTVEVLVKTWMDREACEALAKAVGGSSIGYAFGSYSPIPVACR